MPAAEKGRSFTANRDDGSMVFVHTTPHHNDANFKAHPIIDGAVPGTTVQPSTIVQQAKAAKAGAPTSTSGHAPQLSTTSTIPMPSSTTSASPPSQATAFVTRNPDPPTCVFAVSSTGNGNIRFPVMVYSGASQHFLGPTLPPQVNKFAIMSESMSLQLTLLESGLRSWKKKAPDISRCL